MIFKEAGQLILVIKSCIKMFTHCFRMTFTQTIIQPFIIGIIKTLLLKVPFHIPVHFSHKAKIRNFFTNSFYGFGPEELQPFGPRFFQKPQAE